MRFTLGPRCLAVAKTVGQGIIDTGLATEQTLLAALLGAIAWNLFTWSLGLPSSSSHALFGGLIGAALVQSGVDGVEWAGIVEKIVIPGVLSPIIGFAGAFVLLLIIYWLFFRVTPTTLCRPRARKLVVRSKVGKTTHPKNRAVMSSRHHPTTRCGLARNRPGGVPEWVL